MHKASNTSLQASQEKIKSKYGIRSCEQKYRGQF